MSSITTDWTDVQHSAVKVTSKPLGTAGVTVVVMRADGTLPDYRHEPLAFSRVEPGVTRDHEGKLYPADKPLVDMCAVGTKGAAIGGWAGRKLTRPAVPVPVPVPPSGRILRGLVTDSNNVVPPHITPPLVRMEFALGVAPATIAGVAKALRERGCQLQPLIGGGIPSQSAAKGYMQSLGVVCRGLILEAEWLNETNYKVAASNGGTYALSALGAAEGLSGSGIGLIGQLSDAGQGTTVWIDSAFAAVPHLGSVLSGASIHPYWGGPGSHNADSWGVPMMKRLVAALDKHGATGLPIDATEWGVPSDDGKVFSSGQRATFAEAKEIIDRHPGELQAAAQGRLRSLFLYQAYDQRAHGVDADREHYFGLFTNVGGRKGVMTDAGEAFLLG